jgi:hypothetical protein
VIDIDDEDNPTEVTLEADFVEVDVAGDTEDDRLVEFTVEKDGDDWIITVFEQV